MPEVTETTLAKAQEEFLGRQPIIGIGLARDGSSRLSFVFSSKSAKRKLEIRRWAYRHQIGVDIRVAGPSLEAAA